jgi:CRISPR-associated protein Cmr3
MQAIGLVLEPLDTLFFRGGRPFNAGLSGESGLPTPQGFAGAMRTLLIEQAGGDFRRMRGHPSLEAACASAGVPWLGGTRFRGPWLADISDPQSPKPFVRAPANLVLAGGKPTPLLPLRTPLPGWSPPDDEPRLIPLWLREGKPDKTRPAWIALDGLSSYLHGRPVAAEQLESSDALYQLEPRTGVQIDEKKQAAKESMIYSTRSLRLKPDVAFYGEIELPGEHRNVFDGGPVISWGGERHHVVVRKVKPVCWPEAEHSQRTALRFIVPAFFAARWRPDNLPPGTLRAAAVDGPFAVSGWDLAEGGPKPTRFGTAAGSVYFLEDSPPLKSPCASAGDALTGYGHFLRGTWNYVK